MVDASGVLVLGDTISGGLGPTSRELLAAARKVADDLGEELAIGLLGDTLDVPAQQAISYGADKVYAVTHPLLSNYQVELYLAAMETLCRDVNPSVVLILGRQDLLRLDPARAVETEHVRRAGILAVVVVVGNADHDGVADDRHGAAEEVGDAEAVVGEELLLLDP